MSDTCNYVAVGALVVSYREVRRTLLDICSPWMYKSRCKITNEKINGQLDVHLLGDQLTVGRNDFLNLTCYHIRR